MESYGIWKLVRTVIFCQGKPCHSLYILCNLAFNHPCNLALKLGFNTLKFGETEALSSLIRRFGFFLPSYFAFVFCLRMLPSSWLDAFLFSNLFHCFHLVSIAFSAGVATG